MFDVELNRDRPTPVRAPALRPVLRAAVLALVLVLAGCSLPRIVILNDPLSADEHITLGGIYASQDKPDLAREQFHAAVRQDRRSVRAWMLYGELSLRMGDLREAERAYGEARDLEPGNGDHYNNLAWVLAAQARDLEEAHALVTKALALTPRHRPYYLDTLGVVLQKQGRSVEAVAALRESVATIPADQGPFLAEAYLHLAEACSAAGDDAGAAAARDKHQRLRSAQTVTTPVGRSGASSPD